MSRLVLTILSFQLVIISPVLYAKTAIITMLKGKSEIFVNPSSEPVGSGPHVKFNGLYYKIKKAKIGRRIKLKQVVKTGINSQIKLSFPDGDTFFVGPATAYSLDVDKSKKAKKNSKVMDLLYGKVRAVISKKGALKSLKIKTKTSVAGVRGTDFHMAYFPSDEQTSLSVLRGKVAFNSKASKAPPVEIKSGVTAQVKGNMQSANDKVGEKQVAEVSMKPITKNKLVDIQKVSQINLSVEKKEAVTIELAKLDRDVVAEIEQLNKKSVEIVLDDIKVEDKAQYDSLKANSKSLKSIDSINTVVVSQLFKKAPVEKNVKLSEDELGQFEDVYKKYNKDY